MQKPPQLLPTKLEEGQAPGIRYRIDGELVPVLHTWLDGTVPVFFEHHVVLWKDPPLNISIRAMKGAFKRMVAGMPIFLTEAQGPGEIAFSRDGAGHLFPLHLMPGTAVLVREHQFLAGTGNLGYTFNQGRVVNAVCWHGYRDFFMRLFDLEATAKAVTGVSRYDGIAGFYASYPETGWKNIGSMMQPMNYHDACNCNEMVRSMAGTA
jgi:hypothetical protein